MNTHRAVRQYLAKEEKKTELKSERVELNFLKEIDNAQTRVENKVGKAINRATKVEKEYQAVNSENKKLQSELESERKKMFTLLQDAKDMAADLGITLPSEFNDSYDQLASDIAKVPVSNIGNIFSL